MFICLYKLKYDIKMVVKIKYPFMGGSIYINSKTKGLF
jgi:hypothetical protein